MVTALRRSLTHLLIVVYLGALGWGIFAHAVNFGLSAHPVMYFIVWDMFCGWSSWSTRTELIGEGESGRYYQLAPGPWGEFKPFGPIGRRHYDAIGIFGPRLALNSLRHTDHEPITRAFVVEVCWPKMYNLPDNLWSRRFDRPKDLQRYYQVRHVFTPDGILLQSYPNWLSKQYSIAMASNPRLQADVRNSQPFYVFGNGAGHRPSGTFRPGTGYDPRARSQVGSLLGE